MSSDLVHVPGYVKWMGECPCGLPMTEGKLIRKTRKSHILAEVMKSQGMFLGDYHICVCCGKGFRMLGILNDYGQPEAHEPEKCRREVKEMGLEVLSRSDDTVFGVHWPKKDQTFIFGFDSTPPTNQTAFAGKLVQGRPEVLGIHETWETYFRRK